MTVVAETLYPRVITGGVTVTAQRHYRAKLWKVDLKGQKLLDVDRERERGHDICVINERDSSRSHNSGPTRSDLNKSSNGI
jgi:hypothetical protein